MYMYEIVNQLQKLRELTGNAQLNYLRSINSEILKEILDYTYNPDKTYKIDKVKYDKIIIKKGLLAPKKKTEFNLEDWIEFKHLLDNLVNKRAVTDSEVRIVKSFITSFIDKDIQLFLCMVLFKDLRLYMGIKKIQTVWPDFCYNYQVQLAEDYDGTVFENGFYSRKFDGKRMYIMDGVAYSRSNKPCSIPPIKHILSQLSNLSSECTFDGEILYFNKEGKEDFQKGISLTSNDNRTSECDDLYYVIFDGLSTSSFISKKNNIEFSYEYSTLLNMFEAKPSQRFGYSVLDTKYPNILIARQDSNKDELDKMRKENGWEGLMYRNGDAPYEFKRTKNLLKIKDMQDGEFTLHSLSEGTGKNSGRLGALNIIYENNIVGVGSGFTDEERKLIWDNNKLFIQDSFVSVFSVKVKYFEKTVDSKGRPSLRFPVFLCFRHINSEEEMTVKEVIQFLEDNM